MRRVPVGIAAQIDEVDGRDAREQERSVVVLRGLGDAEERALVAAGGGRRPADAAQLRRREELLLDVELLAADHVQQHDRGDRRGLSPRLGVEVALHVAPAPEQRAALVPVEVEALFAVEEHQLDGRLAAARAERGDERQQQPDAARAVVGADEVEVLLRQRVAAGALGVVVAGEHDALGPPTGDRRAHVAEGDALSAIGPGVAPGLEPLGLQLLDDVGQLLGPAGLAEVARAEADQRLAVSERALAEAVRGPRRRELERRCAIDGAAVDQPDRAVARAGGLLQDEREASDADDQAEEQRCAGYALIRLKMIL